MAGILALIAAALPTNNDADNKANLSIFFIHNNYPPLITLSL